MSTHSLSPLMKATASLMSAVFFATATQLAAGVWLPALAQAQPVRVPHKRVALYVVPKVKAAAGDARVLEAFMRTELSGIVGVSSVVSGAEPPATLADLLLAPVEAGFRALLEMSTYHQIKDGVRYPAVLLTHGVNDPRVEVWTSTKTGARLLAASRSGRPVLLRLQYDSGHGIGNTKSQVFDEVADVYAYALWQMGMPDFQPAS